MNIHMVGTVWLLGATNTMVRKQLMLAKANSVRKDWGRLPYHEVPGADPSALEARELSPVVYGDDQFPGGQQNHSHQ